jgi:hypothetical protein
MVVAGTETCYGLATAALECVLALLDGSIRRRGQLLNLTGNTGLLAVLGLSRSGGGGESSPRDNTNTPWANIIMSACRCSAHLFGMKDATTAAAAAASDDKDASSNSISSSSSSSRAGVIITPSTPIRGVTITPSSSDATACGLYVRIGMELFIASLSARDSAGGGQGDIAVVGAIVGVLQSSIPYLRSILAAATTLNLSTERVNALCVRVLLYYCSSFFSCF